MNPTRAPHIIYFDVGGTLLQSSPSVGAVYSEVAAKHGIIADAREIERRARKLFFDEEGRKSLGERSPHTGSLELAKDWWRTVVRASFGEAGNHPRFDEFYDEVFEEFGKPERFAPFPEVLALLDDLAAAGHKLGIISNWDARLRPILEGMDLARRFSAIVISAEVGVEKPDRRIFEIAREMAEAPPGARIVHIGDSQVDDVGGALEAGFEGRLIDRRKGGDLRAALADFL